MQVPASLTATPVMHLVPTEYEERMVQVSGLISQLSQGLSFPAHSCPTASPPSQLQTLLLSSHWFFFTKIVLIRVDCA